MERFRVGAEVKNKVHFKKKKWEKNFKKDVKRKKGEFDDREIR